MTQFVDALTQYCAPGATAFPAPYSDEWGADIESYDRLSMRDHLKTLDLSPTMRDMVDAMCSLVAFGDMNRSAATECMRVFAMSGCNTTHMLAALTAIKLKQGTRSLIDAMASQAKLTDIQLASPVRRVV